MWGIRVVVPQKLRQRVLEELRTSHMGMNKMKGVARSFWWWPLIDKEIEQLAKSCDACLSVRHSPPCTLCVGQLDHGSVSTLTLPDICLVKPT